MALSPIPRTKTIKKPGRKIPRIETPRRPGPPLTVRGPRPFQKQVEQTDSPGDKVPPGFMGTLPEWYVHWWSVHRRHLIPDLDFEFQSSLFGGRLDLGGLVIDFLYPHLFPPGLVVNVQGFTWHYYTTEQRQADVMTKERLIARGYTVVFAREEDLLKQLDRTMSEALTGRQLFEDTV
jgi:very-short-patch-repair endonuclease